MKLLFSFIIVISTSFKISAQDCSNYFFLQNNKTVEMTISNNKDKETGKMIYVISESKKNGNISSSVINSEFFDVKGKSINKATNNVVCENGIMKMDMKLFIPSAQREQMGTSTANASNVYLEYPAAMNTGEMLKDGEFNMDYESSSGLKSSIEISITERKVEAKESITTPAGTWDCYKITSNNKITSRIAGIGIPIKSSVSEWYAPGFGVVKTESKYGKTEITSIK